MRKKGQANYEVYQGFENAEGQSKGNQRAIKGQSKGNKQEYKECKNDKNIYSSERTHARTRALKNCPNVLLTEEQEEKLLDILSLDEYHNYIENLQDYISKGHKVHNCYQTILKWAERDRQI